MRVAFVLPRYGVDAAGGAEILAQGFVEHLRHSGVDTEVITTCARDHFGWNNHYPPGTADVNGVAVHRFEVNRDRDLHVFAQIQQCIGAGLEVAMEDQRKWVEESVNSRTMYDYIDEHRDDYDFFVFVPYLFGTTFLGSAVCPEKSLLIPTLHDEVYSHLDIFRELFDRVRRVLFISEPEMELGKRLFRIPEERAVFVGFGFPGTIPARPERFREDYGLKDDFLLYVGRREEGKNTPLLTRYFGTYAKRNPGRARLVFLGSGPLEVPDGCEGVIEDLGFLPEEVKYDAHAAASVLCQPSVNESLSIVLMESWLTGVPALVNANCPVTRHHCEKSGGGLYFEDYLEFEESVNMLLGDPGLRRRMGEAGRDYVREVYNWEGALRRFRRALDGDRGPGGYSPPGSG